ncbi:basic proline-rich protein-like [Suncus etruscus]|uniref:basic proline-rich protein-like n=1 Tax=Suncus etruscus TaxID=109475 RepID=UPI002110E24B|nr:basic proline-rich protein-like [Suncus etruscus]
MQPVHQPHPSPIILPSWPWDEPEPCLAGRPPKPPAASERYTSSERASSLRDRGAPRSPVTLDRCGQQQGPRPRRPPSAAPPRPPTGRNFQPGESAGRPGQEAARLGDCPRPRDLTASSAGTLPTGRGAAGWLGQVCGAEPPPPGRALSGTPRKATRGPGTWSRPGSAHLLDDGERPSLGSRCWARGDARQGEARTAPRTCPLSLSLCLCLPLCLGAHLAASVHPGRSLPLSRAQPRSIPGAASVPAGLRARSQPGCRPPGAQPSPAPSGVRRGPAGLGTAPARSGLAPSEPAAPGPARPGAPPSAPSGPAAPRGHGPPGAQRLRSRSPARPGPARAGPPATCLHKRRSPAVRRGPASPAPSPAQPSPARLTSLASPRRLASPARPPARGCLQRGGRGRPGAPPTPAQRAPSQRRPHCRARTHRRRDARSPPAPGAARRDTWARRGQAEGRDGTGPPGHGHPEPGDGDGTGPLCDGRSGAGGHLAGDDLATEDWALGDRWRPGDGDS